MSVGVIDDIINFVKTNNLYISSLYCDILLEDIPKMQEQTIYTSNLAYKLAKFLDNHDKVCNVNYVLLPNHISYNNAIKFFNNLGPNIFIFTIKNYLENMKNWMKLKNKLDLETWFGSAKSRFNNLNEYINPKELKNSIICRVAVGDTDTYEKIHYELIEMLKLL